MCKVHIGLKPGWRGWQLGDTWLEHSRPDPDTPGLYPRRSESPIVEPQRAELGQGCLAEDGEEIEQDPQAMRLWARPGPSQSFSFPFRQ